jgi:hypothetical protein
MASNTAESSPEIPGFTQDGTGEAVARLKLPRAGAHAIELPKPEPADERHNPLFELLVQGEGDVMGLLAYSLYKQNKRDWLIAYQATHSHDPGEAETAAFILSERLPRRVATYRRLAEDMLSQHKDETRTSRTNGLMQAPANDATRTTPAMAVGPPTLQQAAKSPVTWRYIAIMLMMLVAMAIVFRLAGSWLFGTSGR